MHADVVGFGVSLSPVCRYMYERMTQVQKYNLGTGESGKLSLLTIMHDLMMDTADRLSTIMVNGGIDIQMHSELCSGCG